MTIRHVTNLSALNPDALSTVGKKIAEAGIALTVLPATDLFLMGRQYGSHVPRGIAPANALAALGVKTAIATNNVLDPFTPFGEASLVRMANLYPTVSYREMPTSSLSSAWWGRKPQHRRLSI